MTDPGPLPPGGPAGPSHPGPPGPGPGGPDGPDPGALREARALLRAALVVFPLLSLSLILGLELAIPDALFTGFLLGSLPLLSMAQLPLLHGARVDRMSAYTSSVVMLIVLTVVALALGWSGPGLEALGLVPRFSAEDAVLTAGLFTGLAVFGVVSHLAGEWAGVEETPVLKQLIPRSSRERWTFGLVSLSAGLGEEIVYRGYLVVVLGAIFSGPWWAAVASSLAFAILHAYQGGVGIVRSGVLGFVFAAAFIEGGSLWPLIIVHTGVDLVSGLWLGPRMISSDGAQA